MALVQAGVDAVALLGTHLSPEVIRQIENCNYLKVYMALDYDALGKSIENLQKLKNANVIALDKDVKDMNETERMELVNSL